MGLKLDGIISPMTPMRISNFNFTIRKPSNLPSPLPHRRPAKQLPLSKFLEPHYPKHSPRRLNTDLYQKLEEQAREQDQRIIKEKMKEVLAKTMEMKARLFREGKERCGKCLLVRPCKHHERQVLLDNGEIDSEEEREFQERKELQQRIQEEAKTMRMITLQTQESPKGAEKKKPNWSQIQPPKVQLIINTGRSPQTTQRIEYIDTMRGSPKNLDDLARPYSIIATSREEDYNLELQRSEILGYKNTRSFFLRRLNIRKIKHLDELQNERNQHLISTLQSERKTQSVSVRYRDANGFTMRRASLEQSTLRNNISPQKAKALHPFVQIQNSINRVEKLTRLLQAEEYKLEKEYQQFVIDYNRQLREEEQQRINEERKQKRMSIIKEVLAGNTQLMESLYQRSHLSESISKQKASVINGDPLYQVSLLKTRRTEEDYDIDRSQIKQSVDDDNIEGREHDLEVNASTIQEQSQRRKSLEEDEEIAKINNSEETQLKIEENKVIAVKKAGLHHTNAEQDLGLQEEPENCQNQNQQTFYLEPDDDDSPSPIQDKSPSHYQHQTSHGPQHSKALCNEIIPEDDDENDGMN
ncbi:hypothetical protein FGO68_gene11832 [Halteria grandinella]|uniref:Uncharacterized protein n=1 Tax=Halteria grandinella TaxID=5974 RepID=A0A8J8NUI9_HALGN|nr:hypothetical protein FGO68_gene11832 [Halteria grandinella]